MRTLKLTHRSFPFAIASTFSLLSLTACGEKLSAQCQKIGDVMNATSSARLSASGTSEGFSRGAQLSQQAADDLMALEIGDKKLSNLRSHIAASFRSMAEASSAMDAIAGPEGTVTLDKNSSADTQATLAKFESTGQDFSTKFNALQTYCNGGSVPGELVDAPAQ